MILTIRLMLIYAVALPATKLCACVRKYKNAYDSKIHSKYLKKVMHGDNFSFVQVDEEEDLNFSYNMASKKV